jgi:plasmid stabilization system protein ParE
MPYSGRIVPEFESEDFREVIFRYYRIVHRVVGKNNDVEILAVVHGARDLKKLVSEEWEL